MNNTIIINELKKIESLLFERKNTLNLCEAAQFLSMSKSSIYKLTSGKILPFYKPNGKKIYFNRLELEKWLRHNRIKPKTETEPCVSVNIENDI